MKVFALKRLLERTPVWSYRKWIAHGLFWLFLLIVLIVSDFQQAGWPRVLYNKLTDVTFYALLIYVNLLYLIPNYLSKKKFWIYVGLLLLSVVLLTPIKIAIQVMLFSDEPSFQLYFIRNQSYYFLSMFLIGGSSTLYSIISDWFIHQSEKLELQTQTMQSELNFLRSQVNPHFLFNTLNNLYALTLKKSDDAPQIVLKLSEMMRYMLYECNERKVSLKREISYLKNYLDLERLRQHDMIDINLNIRGEIKDQKIAPLLFIPFLENSFKHGLNHQLHHGYVNIDINVESGHLTFHIVNSKTPSQPRQSHRKSGGIGLVNVQRRLNLIYPDNYLLRIQNQPNTYSVNLELDL
ncbi:MAG: histidine kinase [Saprospiraceae bacterium]|nr:histidine kinase [Saprospiraceae bacterium]